MLTKKQMAEVVEFDREAREDYRLRNEEKTIGRRTNRYNYIVVEKPHRGRRGAKPDGRSEVAIVNVAVRLDANYVPVAKEVIWMYPETGSLEYRDLHYRRCAGWIVDWARSDIGKRKARAGERFRIGKTVDEALEHSKFKYGMAGLNGTYDCTVNPGALKGTRYEYCQYADDAPGSTGLMEWLTLYRREPKVELLAKAGLYCFINPAGLKALKDKRVFAWAKDNAEMLREQDFTPPVRYVLWAARHGTTLKEARRHYDLVHNLSYKLDSTRTHLRWPGDDRAGIKLKLDYERLAGLLKKWKVDAYEYGRYIEHAFDAGLDLRNEGTLYPPVRGGRKAFMARLEELEKECARREAERERAERAKMEKMLARRAAEIAAFQESIERTATLRGTGYAIVLAKTQEELLAEGKKMRNCVGNGMYGRGIATGDRLIVMLKDRAKSFCDIEIDRKTWGVRQCYLKHNAAAPREIWELAAEIAACLKAEHKRHRKAGLFKAPGRKSA